jgi:hypothetical protein
VTIKLFTGRNIPHCAFESFIVQARDSILKLFNEVTLAAKTL